MNHTAPEFDLDLGFMTLTFNLSTVAMLLLSAIIVFLIAFISTRKLALKPTGMQKLYGMGYGFRKGDYQKQYGLENWWSLPRTRYYTYYVHRCFKLNRFTTWWDGD